MFWIVAANVAFVFMEAVLAYQDGFLTINQALRAGYKWPCTPFVNHGGMWGDVLLLSPIFVLILSNYASSWKGSSVLIALALGLITSSLMHNMYARISFQIPNFLAHDGRLTAAGSIHIVYMMVALAILLLFYFATDHVNHGHAVLVSVLLAIHIMLGILEPAWYVGDSLRYPPVLYPMLGGWALIGASYWFLTHFKT